MTGCKKKCFVLAFRGPLTVAAPDSYLTVTRWVGLQVPFLDMLNHDNMPNAKYRSDENLDYAKRKENSTVFLYATRDVRKGEEIFISCEF